MANHVYNNITIEGNPTVQKRWDSLFTNYHETVERPSYHGDGTIKIKEYKEIQKHPFFEVPYDEDDWYSWGCEHVGAKWAHIEDADEHYAYIVSAWSPVIPYLESLYNYLRQEDEEVVIRCQYEDEFRNFIGVWQNGDFDEYDGGDLQNDFEEKYKVDLSSDEFEWSDEHKESGRCYDELFDDMVYDWFSEVVV